MVHIRFKYVSYTKNDGWMWRKKVEGKLMSVSLKTHNESRASHLALTMTARYLQLKQLALPFVSLRDALKQYRDSLIEGAMLKGISQSQNFEYEAATPNDVPSISPAIISTAKHTFMEVMDEWAKHYSTEWKGRTEHLNRRTISMFSEWARGHSPEHPVLHVEDVNKQLIATSNHIWKNAMRLL